MNRITRSTDHFYTYEGVTYPGVTGILKIIDKSDALMSWAARQTAEAALALMDSPQVLDAVGPEGFIKAVTSRSSWKRDDAASLGTEVHGYAELIARGEAFDSVPERARQHVAHYAAWWAASGWKLRAAEGLLVNTAMGYGGTFDLLARDPDGKTILADVKTGKAIYNEAVLQLTAYGLAEVVDTGGSVYKMPAPDRYVILHVTANGVREVEVPITSVERGAWQAAITLAAWRATLKGRVL